MPDESFPKIDPEKKADSNVIESPPVTDDSVLVPKINVSESPPPPPVMEPAATPTKKRFLQDMSRKKKIWLGVLIFLGLFLIYNLVAGFFIYRKGLSLMRSADNLVLASQAKDLAKIKLGIEETKRDLDGFKSTFSLIGWTKIIPYMGGYTRDAGHAINAGQSGLEAGEILVTVIEPYSDLLGFTLGGDSAVLGEKTAEETTQDRIDFIVKTIPDLLPKVDEISAKVKTVNDEISLINYERYPENFRGKPLKSKIKSVVELSSQSAMFITNSKPVLESAPYLLGMDSPRTYMILFQNDKELRPTGGFMTAYAIMKVENAKFEPVSSNDIYNLDALYKPSIPAPDPIVNYIKGPYILSKNLRLRDMNWSPDFEVSMKLFTDSIKEVGVTDIDGIIAVDTQMLTNLLDVIGPIGVPGFGNFSTDIDPECNCPQVIHELESYADVEGPIIWDPLTGEIILKPKNADNRKLIIGPLMNSIMANALGQPKEKLPALFEAGFKSLIEKHVLFYLFDETSQSAMVDFGLAGVVKPYDGDFLHVNDSNLGGRKSNLYATQDVEQNISIEKDGSVTKTVTITYKNPEKHDGWLNSVLPTWVRLYVPKGSMLIASEGLEAKEDPYDDLNYTVYSGFFQLRPEGVSKVTFQYKLPFTVSKEYKLFIHKQPGTDGFLYTIDIGKRREEFFLKTDKELKIAL